jgi:hypothetical protein
MENNNSWSEYLTTVESFVSDYGIYDVIAKIVRKDIVLSIYRARIEKGSMVSYGHMENEKLCLIIQGSCTMNDKYLTVGNSVYIPANFCHTLSTDEGLEILIILFKTN